MENSAVENTQANGGSINELTKSPATSTGGIDLRSIINPCESLTLA